LLVALGLSLDPHHDVVAGVLRQVVEDWMVGEVNVLQSHCFPVVRTHLYLQDQLVELGQKVFNAFILLDCHDISG
jgi:hypothetical protein